MHTKNSINPSSSSDMSINQSINQSRGFDILKFIGAIVIVATHCLFLIEYPILLKLFNRFNCLFIPVFFCLSSYFFTRKLYSSPESGAIILKKSIVRLIILFCIWYILMMPVIWETWWSKANAKETIHAVLFSCTYPTYWYIKALIINFVILYGCFKSKTFRITAIVVFSIYYIVVSYNNLYPTISLPFEAYPNFAFHVLPCFIGMYAAKRNTFNFFNLNVFASSLLFVALIAFSFFYGFIIPVSKLAGCIILCSIFEQIQWSNSYPYIFLRKSSIILYMSHVGILTMYTSFFENSDSILSHSFCVTIFTLTTCIIIAYTIVHPKLLPRLNSGITAYLS